MVLSKIFRGSSWLKYIFGSLLLASLVVAGCSQSESDNSLKVGVIAGPEAELMQVAAQEAAKQGLKVNMIEFTDYISPNVALAEGSIDVNAYQHKPYLDSMIKNRGLKLAAVGPTFIYPIGGYSKSLKSLNELSDNAKVAIPNDPTNEGRTLILLDKVGLIKLKDPSNLQATPADIIANPKKLRFIEIDAAQLPRVLDDVALDFINSTYSVAAGLLPQRDALLLEDKDSAYVNLVVSRDNNKNDPRIKLLLKSYQSQAVIDKAKELFKGGAIPGWQ